MLCFLNSLIWIKSKLVRDLNIKFLYCQIFHLNIRVISFLHVFLSFPSCFESLHKYLLQPRGGGGVQASKSSSRTTTTTSAQTFHSKDRKITGKIRVEGMVYSSIYLV